MKKRKTKELSAAMAESSSTDQPQTPRKRGRPRKNPSEKNEDPKTKKSDQEYSQGPDSKKAADIGEGDRGAELENEKTSKDDEEKVGPSSKDQPQAEAPRKSRGRRKSKPRKSS